MSASTRPQVILLPGGVLPAEVAYPDLVSELGPDVEAIPTELQVYESEQPSAAFGLDDEVAGVLRAAERDGFEQFHLVGYSAGGAVGLAFAARHPERLLSLSLLEPAWAGNEGLSSEEEAASKQFDRIVQLPAAEMMTRLSERSCDPALRPPRRPRDPLLRGWPSARPASPR